MGDRSPSPEEKGRGFPPEPHAGRGCPLPFFLPSRGALVFLLRPKGGEGDSLLQASPPVPLSPSPPHSVASPRGSSAGGVPSPSPVSRVPGASPPPVLWPCPCPRGRERRIVLPVPRRLRGLHGRILFPRCHWAMWRGGSADGRGALAPDSRSASRPQASLSDHG